jgi:hypothetical protein
MRPLAAIRKAIGRASAAEPFTYLHIADSQPLLQLVMSHSPLTQGDKDEQSAR